MNVCCAQLLGFKNLEDGIGRDYSEIQCRSVELCHEWQMQDAQVLQAQQPQKYLGYVCYASDRWCLVVGEKKHFRTAAKEKETERVICHFTEITDLRVADIFPFLKYPNGNIKKKQFTVNLLDRYPSPAAGYLNTTESECLFFLLRGKTFGQIAALLGLAFSQVERYVYALKVKFNAFSKGELIEKALDQGYLNFIPETLFSSRQQFREAMHYR